MQTKYLKAAMLCVSKEATRYYLNGIAIQPIRSRQVNIVSTDGHRMFAAIDTCEDTDRIPASIIIPTEAVKKALTGYKPDTIALHGDDDGTWYLNDIRFTPIDATYPDWHRIMPAELSGITAQFNPPYINDFGRISKAVGSSGHIHVHHNDDCPALITWNDENSFGVLMPLRSISQDTKILVDHVLQRQSMAQAA